MYPINVIDNMTKGKNFRLKKNDISTFRETKITSLYYNPYTKCFWVFKDVVVEAAYKTKPTPKKVGGNPKDKCETTRSGI